MNSSNCTDAEVFSADISTSTRVLLGCMFALFIVLGSLGNGALCFLVYHQAAMRSPINLLLATMALMDTLICLLCLPFDVATVVTNRWIFGATVCRIHACVLAILSTENFALLFMISFDRYLIIVKRRDELTSGHIPFLLFGSVCVSVLICCPPLFGWGQFGFGPEQTHCSLLFTQNSVKSSYGAIYYGIFFLFPCLMLVVFYFCVVQAVRKTAVRIADFQAFNRPTDTEKKRNRTLRLDFQFKIRTFSTIFYLFLGILVCRTPMSVIQIMWTVGDTTDTVNQTWIMCLLYCNSFINPVIYMQKIRKYRRSVKQKLSEIGRICCNGDYQRKGNAADAYKVSYTVSSTSSREYNLS